MTRSHANKRRACVQPPPQPSPKLGGGGLFIIDRRSALAWLLALASAPFAPHARAEVAVVEMRQFKFAPAEIEIAVGRSIDFVNLDLVPHTATASDKSFDTGILRKGDRTVIAFPAAGEFAYVCRFHHHMTGRILVR